MTSRATRATNSWIVTPRPNPSAPLRLFCFPYAGGGASVFNAWPALLPAEVELCAVQLPGREWRLGEPMITDPAAAIDALSAALAPAMDRPFAFFGHSMGALLAYELARRLRAEGRRQPAHLFVSGRPAPHLPAERTPIHALPEAEFIQRLRELEGTPEAVFQDAEMMSIFLPILRADLTVAETFPLQDGPPLSIPISAYGGLADVHAAPERVREWRRHTDAEFRSHIFPGGHFFLNERRPEVLAELSRELRRTLLARLSRA